MNTAKLAATLRKIADGRISREEAAQALGCSARQVNRLMRAHSVERPPGLAHAQRAAAAERKDRKLLAADEMIAGRDVVSASKGVCSVRTLYRLVAKRRKSMK